MARQAAVRTGYSRRYCIVRNRQANALAASPDHRVMAWFAESRTPPIRRKVLQDRQHASRNCSKCWPKLPRAYAPGQLILSMRPTRSKRIYVAYAPYLLSIWSPHSILNEPRPYPTHESDGCMRYVKLEFPTGSDLAGSFAIGPWIFLTLEVPQLPCPAPRLFVQYATQNAIRLAPACYVAAGGVLYHC